MSTAPVVLFAFNRPEAFRKTLEALAANDLAADTDLFVRLDGPRGEQDAGKVARVRDIALEARGFRSVEVVGSDTNQGLAASIIRGVDRVLERCDSVIVLEDDLVTHPGFLSFMNAGLERYGDCPEVFSVCGYSHQVRMPSGYGYDAYFCPRSSSWGWGTWRDRWQSVDWNPTPADLQKNAAAFNRWGGSDCAHMLRQWMEGENSSWAIRFCFSQFLQGKISLFPTESLVDPSAGFDGDGTHCKTYNRFRYQMAAPDRRRFALPEIIEVIPSVRRGVLHYHSLYLRAWTRLMNVLHR